jgi:hypothetical protein
MNTLMFKLPDSVTDDALLRLGEIKFHVTCTDSSVAKLSMMRDAITSSGGARIIGDGYFTNESGTENLGKTIAYGDGLLSLDFYLKGTEFDLYISDKYTMYLLTTVVPGTSTAWGFIVDDGSFDSMTKLQQINLYRVLEASIDLKELAESPLTRITGGITSPTFKGDVANLAKETINIIEIYGGGIDILTGNIELFAVSTGMTSFRINYANLSGNIETLGVCTGLTSIGLENSSQVVGTVEGLLDAMFTNGRRSGQVTINVKGTSATYNGTVPTSDLVATFSGSGWSVA